MIWLLGCHRDDPPAECEPDWATWENFGEPVVHTWCTPCHSVYLTGDARNGAPDGVDLDSLDDVRARADRVAERVGGGTMPPAGGLSDDQRDELVRWLSCGAPGVGTEPPPPDPCATPRERAGDVTASVCPDENVVTGSVTVDGDGDWSCLCRVDGSLEIRGGTAFSAPLLAEVGGDLVVTGPMATVDLPGLLAVGGAVRVEQNPGLARLDLDRLGAIGGDYRLVGNPVLVDWRGDAAPRTIGGSIAVEDDDGLDEFTGFGRLTSVGGSISIVGNAALTRVLGLEILASVPGDLIVADNPAVTLVETLPNGVLVAGQLRIGQSPALAEISGFDFLTSVGGVELDHLGLPLFDDAFPALATVGAGGIAVHDDAALVGVSGFGALAAVAGPVSFTDDAALLGIELPAVETVGALALSGDPSLSDVRLPALRLVYGSVEVRGTDAKRLDDLAALNQVAVDLALVDNPRLADVSALLGVQNVGGVLVIRDNPALATADAEALAAAIDPVGGADIAGNGP